MATPTSPHRRAGRPPATSLPAILAAARTLIDRDGWERLTIRGLAAELGIGATTLYHHVRDKDDLLVHLLNELAARTPRPELPSDPRDRIVVAAVAGHDLLAAWPWAVEVITNDGYLGRLDESAAWTSEAIVAGAIDAGCTLDQAVYLFRSIWFYTVGEILVRAHSPGGVDLSTYPDGTFFHGADMAKLPNLAAIGNDWIEIENRDTFRPGLEAFVDGLLAQARAGTDHKPAG
ncbi:TetR/AcrR family transcriptional regulator [Microlunatus speluncae]|uniref:TetR/AcrR family transcriptional regulator n=1 Tax=Microlunatus speluncae TaxID=2594267 RepID=UPI0012661A0E|nr:TetR/AcrR family transcriptional regulator [Microlunatus speluncae]